VKPINLPLYLNLPFEKLWELAQKIEHHQPNAYWTPVQLVRDLLDRVNFPGPSWEPAVGAGNIAKELVERGYKVYGSDIIDYGFSETIIGDFYTFRPTFEFRSIVTNPPFVDCWKWVERCCKFSPEKLAVLLPTSGLCDCLRCLDLYKFNLSNLLMYRRCPKFEGPSGVTDGGAWGLAWFVLSQGGKGIGEVEAIG
jgi:hypothetical protein